MNKMGFNIQVPGEGLDLIEEYRPEYSLLMDIKSEHVAKAHQYGTKVIFRKEDGKKWRDKDPVAWVQAMWADVHECPPDWVVLDNEPLGHDAVNEFAEFDQWQRAAADWVHANTPMKVGMFSFAEGNFTVEGPIIPMHFPLSMEAADAVFIHEYWKPHLDSLGMESYHCLRWDAWLKWFEDAGYPDVPIYVTECGITMAVNALPHGDPSGPDMGYASEEARAVGVTAETYLADLQQYHWRCCQEPRIKALMPFIWKNYPGNEWSSFVPTPEMTERIFAFDAPEPEPSEPEPPQNGGDEMDIKVVDLEYKERDFQYAKEKYGVAFRRAEAAPGQKVYRLMELWEKTGNSSLTTKVLGADGRPQADVPVTFYWPDAPRPPDPPTTVYSHDWHDRFTWGLTNAEGDIGPGMGPGAYIDDVAEGGPHAVWVHDPTIPSDICEKLGMLPGTVHDHLEPVFKLTTAGEENGGGDMDDLVIVERIEELHAAAAMLYIAYPVTISFDTRGRAGSSAAADLDTTEPDSYEYDGRTFARVGVCADFEGDAPREYWIEAHDLPSGKAVTPRVTETFNPLPDRRKVTYVVDFAGEPIEPEPEPPEPSEDPAQRLRDLGDYLRDELYSIAAGLSSEVAGGTLTLRMKGGNVQTFAVTPSGGGAGLLARAWAGVRGLVGR